MAPRFWLRHSSSDARTLVWTERTSRQANRIRMLSLNASTGRVAQTCANGIYFPTVMRSEKQPIGG